MPKILLISNGYPDKKSSANIFVKNQADGLRKKGLDIGVMVVDLRSIRRFRKYGISKLIIDDIPFWFIAFPWGGYRSNLSQNIFNFFARILFKSVVRDFGIPDILHAHFGSPGIAGALIKKLYGIPLVITEHSSLMLPINKDEKQKQRFVRAYNNADRVIAVSSVLANEISKRGVRNVSVIPNIIPNFYFNRLSGRTPVTGVKFISVGNLTSNKRFDLLISAFSKLIEKHSDAELIIAGNGPLFQSLSRTIHAKKLGKNVFLAGYVKNTELPELYRQSICFVLPSEYETFGVVYIEAMACGIPVIATECGGPQEIVNSRNGLLIKRNNEEELYHALCYMYENHMRYNAHEIAMECYERFGEDNVIKSIMKVYNRLVTD